MVTACAVPPLTVFRRCRVSNSRSVRFFEGHLGEADRDHCVAVYYYLGGRNDAYRSYRSYRERRDDGLPIAKETFFGLVPGNVRFLDSQRFACPICRDCGGESASESDAEALKAHNIVVSHQRDNYLQSLKSLNPGTVLIAFDFSPYSSVWRSQTTMQEENVKLQALHVVVFWNPGDGVVRRYVDFFAEGAHDYSFVRVAMFHLFHLPCVKHASRVISFSDTGPSHFRIRWTIALMCVELRILFQKTSVVCNFFAPYHGKGPYDAHAGNVKRHLRAIGRAGAVTSGAEGIAREVDDKFETTIAFDLTKEVLKIGDAKVLFPVRPIGQIKKFQQFSCVDTTHRRPKRDINGRAWYSLQCWELSDKGSHSSRKVCVDYEFQDPVDAGHPIHFASWAKEACAEGSPAAIVYETPPQSPRLERFVHTNLEVSDDMS